MWDFSKVVSASWMYNVNASSLNIFIRHTFLSFLMDPLMIKMESPIISVIITISLVSVIHQTHERFRCVWNNGTMTIKKASIGP